MRTGVALNELTATEWRDPRALTPWHKHVPARVEAVGWGGERPRVSAP